jgi:hypothetical protein
MRGGPDIIPRMGIPDFLEKWGHLVWQNPIAFILFAGIVGAATWRTCRGRYLERIAVLNDRIAALKESSNNKAAISPSLSQDQRGQIVRCLRQYVARTEDGKGVRTVSIQIELGITENEEIAKQFQGAIKDAEWSAKIDRAYPRESYTQGIWILGPDLKPGEPPNTRTILKRALSEAGFQCQEHVEGFMEYNDPWLAFLVLGKIDRV